MRGVIVIHADVGHVLRSRCITLRRRDVLDCSGEFHAGDRVHVVMRTRDGSQYVVASGTACLDAAACRQRDDALGDGGESAVVIWEQDMVLCWPPSS